MESEPPFQEDRDADGVPRHGYADAFAALDGVDLDALSRSVAQHLEGHDVRFGPDPFVVDPMPRLISAPEWDALAAGLAQRARALNRFLLDAYGDQRIVTAGLIAAEAIAEAEGFEPDLMGGLPGRGSPAAIIGFDIVRSPTGQFLVLEDNLRTPSGYAYAVAARSALQATLPPGFPQPLPIDPRIYELLGGVMRAAAPPGRGDDPLVVVLSDGPANVAYYEHALAATRLGVPLVTPAEVIQDGDRLRLGSANGEARLIDVVYRRTDEDRIRDEHGRMTEVAELLLPAWRSGGIGLVNAFGNGVADDKLVHGHVEDFIRFYLGQEPLVRSVPTRMLGDPAEHRKTLGRLHELVVKPRHGHGGKGVVIGAHAEPSDLDQLAQELQRQPERYVAQPIVPLSTHPTVIDGQLRPRHVDLRPFAFFAEDVELLPGGLTRVALDPGSLVVNSSQNGGGKDTWVIG